jgi:glutamate/tyrosine decarboxylase-like PLP-dependent enzyme
VGYHSGICHVSTKKGLHLKDVPIIREIPAYFSEESQTFEVNPEEFEAMVKEDIDNGNIPFFLGVTIGATSTGGSDDVNAMGEIAKKYGLWFNVDCAWAGAAFVCSEFVKPYLEGLKVADSLQVNLAKWYLTGACCAVTWVGDKSKWIQAISGKDLEAEYLKHKYTDAGDVVDYKDWHISLGKRFNGLRIWYIVRNLGLKGLRAMIRRDIEIAQWSEKWFINHKRVDLLTRRELALLCFRITKDQNGKRYPEEHLNAINKVFLEKINESGEFHLTPSTQSGVYFGRICICNASTTEETMD